MITPLFELAVVILLASGFGVLAKFLRQPTILAYIVTGAVIGYLGFFNLEDGETFRLFSDLGIMFLLFLVGLEIDYKALRLVGRTSVIVGIGQILITFVIGFFLCTAFGFQALPAAYIAIALTFSSTIIVVKLLADKKDLGSLYGRISIGVLLVQDIVAIFILMILAGVSQGENIAFGSLIIAVAKGFLLAGGALYIGRILFPPFFALIARSSELLFLSSLAWVLLFATLSNRFGLSLEIGGFLAGIALANSSEHFQIASRVRPLRDFFIVIFFVLLGYSVVLSNFSGLMKPIMVFSLFVLLGNPLIVWVLMGFFGYRKRTIFLVGITVAQISEFSLVLGALGLRAGHINEEALAIITGVGIITITISTYMILYAERLFSYFEKFLSFFERRVSCEEIADQFTIKKQMVLVGGHRIGQSIASNVQKQNVLIIDFDPEIIASLRAQGFDCLFGDIADEEIRERAKLDEVRLVVSTSPNFEDNMTLLENIQRLVRKPKVIVRAETERDAELLYQKDADYVILPHFTSGHYIGRAVAADPTMAVLDQLKRRDLLMIQNLAKS